MTMKSIMEEASSIAKAVEKCWQRAGNPVEFKIKIFEEPKYNFLGFCIKEAKVAIFYVAEASESENKEKTPQPKNVSKKNPPREANPIQPNKQRVKQAEVPKATSISPESSASSAKPNVSWSSSMVDSVADWVNGTLEILKSSSTAVYTVNNNYLKINFNNHITNNQQKERQLYRSLAYLVMAGMRNKFKFESRNLKLVISNEKNSSES